MVRSNIEIVLPLIFPTQQPQPRPKLAGSDSDFSQISTSDPRPPLSPDPYLDRHTTP
jgi:hypothetical protein